MASISVMIATVAVIVMADFGGAIASNFDLCGHEMIQSKEGIVSFGSLSIDGSKGPFECRRVVQVNSGKIKLVLKKRVIDSQDVFLVYDGANTGFTIASTKENGYDTYETSGNTILLVLKAIKPNNDVSSREIQANFSAINFQDSCHCGAVSNGALVCNESLYERQCSLNCTNEFVNLTPSPRPFSCDLKTGQWARSVETESSSCQKASFPQRLKLILTITYGYNNCALFNESFIRKALEGTLKADTDIASKGECFKFSSQLSPNCDINPMTISCKKNNNQSVVTAVVQDRAANPTKDHFLQLNASYVNGISIDKLRTKLVFVTGNDSYPVTAINKGHVTPVCLDGDFYISKPLAQPVCSKCPQGHYYEAASQSCNKCPSGQHAPEGSTSCTPLGDKTPGVPIKSKCQNKCMKGKELDSAAGHCQWCGQNTYQSSEQVLNPKCSPCPAGKMTLFTGARSVNQCFSPCNKGTYFSVGSSQCEACPLSTYMDKNNHVITGCQSCSSNKVTSATGSKKKRDCILPCKVGYFYDSKINNCTACSMGTYQDRVNQISCTNCTVGRSTFGVASTSGNDCIKTCTKGKYVDKGDGNACKVCQKGTYQDLEGHLQDSCKKCDAGKSTPREGAEAKGECSYSCVAGQYYSVEDSKCVGCSVGFYQPKTGQENCILCPPGTSTIKDSETSKDDCVKLCDQGEYYNKESSNCSLCPKGTYQSATRHTKTSCQPCSSNYSHKTGSTNSSECVSVCLTYPCMSGAACVDIEGGYECKCPQGRAGKDCEVVANADELEKVSVLLRFTSLEWTKEMAVVQSPSYRKMRNTIESAVMRESKDAGVVAVKVTSLKNGSIVAAMVIYTSINSSLVPVKPLQVAVAYGTVDGFPVDPKSLRIRQQSCRRALGMENGRITDEQITASSSSESCKPSNGRLNDAKGWTAQGVGQGDYLQVTLVRPANVTAIVTQGASEAYVRTFALSFSSDGKTWNDYGKNFTANNDSDSQVRNSIEPPISDARYIRVTAVSWVTRIAMRIELYGCVTDPVLSSDEIPIPQTTASPTERPGTTTEPNIGASGRKDGEYAWGKYLGIVFGVLMIVGVALAAFFWCRSSRRKKAEREKSPLVMAGYPDSRYRVIDKNADDYEEEDVV